MIVFRDWTSILNDPEVQFSVKRHYNHDIIVCKMTKIQNHYYVEYKLSGHDEKSEIKKTSQYAIHNTRKPKLTSKTPTQGKGIKMLTPKHKLQRLPRALAQVKTSKCNAIYRIICNMDNKTQNLICEQRFRKNYLHHQPR